MNQQEMTDQEIIIEIAELDGWEFDPHANGLKNPNPILPSQYVVLGINHPNIPKYLSSRDAIVPVIEKQTQKVKEGVVERLWEMLDIDSLRGNLLCLP